MTCHHQWRIDHRGKAATPVCQSIIQQPKRAATQLCKTSSFKLNSKKRRRERYQIIFIWKVAQGLVQGYQATFITSERRGRKMQLAPLCNQAPASVRKARESSLQVKGARLFNCIPRELRDTSTGTSDQFKAKLDAWLSTIPDQPTVPGRQRAAASNSLLDQTVLQM